jgi:predicted RNA-binding protein
VQVPKHPIGGAEDLLDEQQVVNGEVVQTKVD